MIINFLVEKENYSRRAAYVIRNIARRLGYPYQIINDSSKISSSSVTVVYAKEADLGEAARSSAIIILNSEKIHQLERAEKQIDLFQWKEQAIPVIGGMVNLKMLKQWKASAEGYLNHIKRGNGRIIPFDLYLNIFYHLSRFEEKWRHFTDETQTDHATSLLSRYDDLKNPLVDVLVMLLDVLIRKKIDDEKMTAVRVMNWPGGEQLGVSLSHDVDITREISWPARILKHTKKIYFRLSGRNNSSRQLNEEIKEKDAQAWNFPQLITFYTEQGWHATFFFLAKWLEGRHFRYNIRSKKFISLFEQLRQAGHEIALHPSKYAFDKASTYRDEKNKLAAASGVKVQGMRQHYLRAKFPRLWVLAEKAGLLYDASLGYNFQSGFRAGTTFPFQTYDFTEEKLLSLTEFSLHLFEYNLTRSPAEDIDPRSVIKKVVGQVAKYGGLFVTLLHPSNYSREPYRSQWDYLLAELSGYKIFVASLTEHLEWRRRRERIKLSWTDTGEEKKQLIITLPEDLSEFSLEIIGGRLSPANEHVDYADLGSGCYRIKTAEQKISVTLISDAR